MKTPLRVLLVEDNDDDAQILAQELERAGYDVHDERVDSQEGLEMALERHPWDIIFCDYRMPQFRGTDALKLIREKDPNVPFIFVSGTMGEDMAVSAMKAGAHDYIVKGHLKRLIPAVQRELQEAKVRSQRNQMEKEIRQHENQFRMIMENVADLIALLDVDGRRIYNSPSYSNVLGNPEELRGTNSFEEVHPEDREKVKNIFQETVKTGVGQRSEYRMVTKDESVRFIESQGSVIRDINGNVSGVLVVSRDITEKKSLEQQFLRAQRMESIGVLAGGIAHDLNNVFAPILMGIGIIKKNPQSERNPVVLETLESSARRGAAMVRQVLTFARGTDGERDVLQVRHLIEEIIRIIEQTFPRSITVSKDLTKDLWPITGDATQLHQVLLNLSVNSRDAMPSGGKLTLTAQNIVIDDGYAQMDSNAKKGRYVVIGIADTGMGIPQEIKDRIFEPFFTTKEVGKGTGLGLATVNNIVKSHDGFLNVYSEVGNGTQFKVYLPAAQQPGTNVADAVAVGLPFGNNELILIIDDEASIREVTRVSLEAWGYRVLVAKDGAEAIALFAQQRETIKLIITDIMMPVLDGPATIRAIRHLDAKVKIIATSGLMENEPEIADEKFLTFLQKPYTSEQLLFTIHKMLTNG